jgi:copper(I)-binding protein
MGIAMYVTRLAAFASILLLAGCDGAPEQPNPVVENALLRLPAVTGRPGSAYFTIRGGERDARLVGVSSKQVSRIELHESRMEGGMMKMAPLEEPRIIRRGELVFAPGGKHAMLFGIAPDVKAGSKVAVTFTFDPGPAVTVEADVLAAGDASHDH